MEFDPDVALESAMQLFWSRGYEYSSLQMLIKEMGISKSSFYQTFESKHALFRDCLLRYRRHLTADLSERESDAGPGKPFITSLFLGVVEDEAIAESRRGCFLMNTASEFGQSDPEIASLVSESLNHLTDIFEQAINYAQSQGEVSQEKDARALASYLVSSISGIKNMLKAGVDPELISSIVDTSLAVLD